MNNRSLHLAMLVLCLTTLPLLLIVAYQDSENWGYLQHFSLILISALLGAGILNSVAALGDAS